MQRRSKYRYATVLWLEIIPYFHNLCKIRERNEGEIQYKERQCSCVFNAKDKNTDISWALLVTTDITEGNE